MPALLNRIFRRADAGPSARLVAFGPQYSLSGDRLVIGSGPLAGTTLRLSRELSKMKADYSLFELPGDSAAGRETSSPDPIAHCHFDRSPDTGSETLWGIFVRSDFRHRGLTTLLARITFRELLASGRRHWFSIRKLMQVDTEGRSQAQAPGSSRPDGIQPPRISLHNLGIGLVALRLGFRPEPDIERLLAPGKVRAVQAIPPDPPSPPGLLLRLEVLPGLLVAAFVDPRTAAPVTDAAAYERFVSPRQLLRQAQAGEAVIGNIDYILARSAIEHFAARMADDHAEFRHFAVALSRGVQN